MGFPTKQTDFPTPFPTAHPTAPPTEFPTAAPTLTPTQRPTSPPTIQLSSDAHVCVDFKCTYKPHFVDGKDLGKTQVIGHSWSHERWECNRTPGTTDCTCICDW